MPASFQKKKIEPSMSKAVACPDHSPTRNSFGVVPSQFVIGSIQPEISLMRCVSRGLNTARIAQIMELRLEASEVRRRLKTL
jgi:hypothetical protein